MFLLRYLLWFLASCFLRLRYRLTIHGLEQVKNLRGALILPNHPAYIDPPNVLRALWPSLQPRPMLLASMFHSPALRWIPPLLNAVQIPDLQAHSSSARTQAQTAIQEVIAGLSKKQNFILWPSGHVQNGPTESLGAARSLTDILTAAPDANILLVRTRGLRGSRFSYDFTGHQPHLIRRLLQALGLLIANLLFFFPRRNVTITIEKIDRASLPPLERQLINPFFERWYNAPGAEQPTFVPAHFCFGPRQYAFPPMTATTQADLQQITPATRQTVSQILTEHLHDTSASNLDDPATTLDSLGLDSIDRMDLSLAIEQRFGFRSSSVPATVGDLWALAQGLTNDPTATSTKPVAPLWTRPSCATVEKQQAGKVVGQTIPAAFLHRAIAQPSDAAAADDLAGVVTYRKLLLSSISLSQLLQTQTSPLTSPSPATPTTATTAPSTVGILLPACVAADISFLAVHFAGKIPAMLNWTTGPAAMAHAIELTKTTHIITSRKFLDRAAIRLPDHVQCLYLEDIRSSLSKTKLLLNLLRIVLFPRSLSRFFAHITPDQPAVILFTSGSEKSPKAVPLSHRNMLSNMQSALTGFSLTHHDSLIAFLPPFHSFGLTLTTLLPLLAGLRVVHHPDPTDAPGLIRKIAAYQPTILAATPTFFSHILQRAKKQPDDLACLNLIVVGAEKCPDHLFQLTASLLPNAQLLEGYGITECAPLVAANLPHPHPQKQGTLGHAVPGVSLMVVDPQTHQPLPVDQTGLLLVQGENVFHGYLHDPNNPTPSPFLQFNNKRWYITGDLAKLDSQNFLHFAGRLKRFIKVSGEMISLPAIEQPLAQAFPPDDNGHQIAIEGIETPTGRKIVAFTTRSDLTLKQANSLLTSAGLPALMRIDEIQLLPNIPILGTGKIDYKILRAKISST